MSNSEKQQVYRSFEPPVFRDKELAWQVSRKQCADTYIPAT